MLRFEGVWAMGAALPLCADVLAEFEGSDDVSRVRFEIGGVERWDSRLLNVMARTAAQAGERKMDVDEAGLPDKMREILELSRAVPATETTRRAPSRGFLEDLGERAIEKWGGFLEFLEFFGECTVSLCRFFTGRARIRWKDFWGLVQHCGFDALGIVALISFLVGLIIAFLGAVVLRQFGASIYVSYLVGYGILREMGAMMTGVIMAGRTGAAFAAQLGSMKVTEEIDALRTLGISPIDFLVLPRMLALFVMMPLLVVYADIIGVLAGLSVAVLSLDISAPQYFDGMRVAVGFTDFMLGVIKGVFFGGIVAVCGCLRGMQAESSADGVGVAATSAVVTAITLIIVADATFAVACELLGI